MAKMAGRKSGKFLEGVKPVWKTDMEAIMRKKERGDREKQKKRVTKGFQ